MNNELNEEYIEELINWIPKNIHEKNYEIIKLFSISNKLKKEYFDKLKNYHYINNIFELIYGSHIILINKIYELKSLIFCGIAKNNENNIICKGYGRFSNFFQINSNDYIIFQKNTKDEELLSKTAEILFS
jgi:hypothetical protein